MYNDLTAITTTNTGSDIKCDKIYDIGNSLNLYDVVDADWLRSKYLEGLAKGGIEQIQTALDKHSLDEIERDWLKAKLKVLQIQEKLWKINNLTIT